MTGATKLEPEKRDESVLDPELDPGSESVPLDLENGSRAPDEELERLPLDALPPIRGGGATFAFTLAVAAPLAAAGTGLPGRPGSVLRIRLMSAVAIRPRGASEGAWAAGRLGEGSPALTG